MVHYSPDPTGRFVQRPFYLARELDDECERVITALLMRKHGRMTLPIGTEDLKVLIEREADELDWYADLTHYGPDTEGVTEFHPGGKPRVEISALLSEDPRRENRLRTTLSHEYGHVHFHGPLFEMSPPMPDLLRRQPDSNKVICKRDRMIDAPKVDWLEWQAGYVCGAILMPRTHIVRLVGEYQEAHGLFGPPRHNGPHGRALMDAVMAVFQVSAEAARVRLSSLNLVGVQDPSPSLFG